ncbi:hypothetical protein SK128_010044 [Halocaridina rubra]|uniref:Uncharacterized protein n=1 Tax=Halocaridina rubra TaxID=373956 RepID=A0AAN8WXX5_HALRR
MYVTSPSFGNLQNNMCVKQGVSGSTVRQTMEQYEDDWTPVETYGENVLGWKEIRFSIDRESTVFSMPALQDRETYTYVVFNCFYDGGFLQHLSSPELSGIQKKGRWHSLCGIHWELVGSVMQSYLH